ncbi:hypothetical protein V2G26_000472 [Clonostachys chloroleuca]
MPLRQSLQQTDTETTPRGAISESPLSSASPPSQTTYPAHPHTSPGTETPQQLVDFDRGNAVPSSNHRRSRSSVINVHRRHLLVLSHSV